MSFLNSLASWFKAIFRSIFKFITKLLKTLWPIILVAALIYFAPAISSWLVSSGAPTWLSGAFGWVGTSVTPLLTSAVSGIWSGTTALAGSAWTAFKAASLTTQLMVLGATAALIAPDETAAVISDAVTTVAGVVSDVASTVGTTIATTSIAGIPLWLWGVGGLAAYFILTSKGKSDQIQIVDERSPT